MAANAGLVDGILCVSQPLKELVCRHLPELEASRVQVLPLPISRCPIEVPQAPLQGRPIVIGVNGRLVKEQKRIDRLPRLIQVLDRARLNYRLELLGDGPDQLWLEQHMASHPRVQFHGRKTGGEYWKIVAGWDVILFTSDFEGLPLALLEAMSAGVLPVYPRINSGGEFYVYQVNPEFLHDTEDFPRVAAVLAEIASAAESRVQAWREISRSVVEPHAGDAYDRTYSSFVRQIREMPRVSNAHLPRRQFYVSDFLPFVILGRFYLRGFHRPNRAPHS